MRQGHDESESKRSVFTSMLKNRKGLPDSLRTRSHHIVAFQRQSTSERIAPSTVQQSCFGCTQVLAQIVAPVLAWVSPLFQLLPLPLNANHACSSLTYRQKTSSIQSENNFNEPDQGG